MKILFEVLPGHSVVAQNEQRECDIYISGFEFSELFQSGKLFGTKGTTIHKPLLFYDSWQWSHSSSLGCLTGRRRFREAGG